jgi:hypothetical protein
LSLTDFEQAYPDFETLQSTYFERIRRRAEKAVRSLIHAEYRRRFSIELSRGGGSVDRSGRFLLAYKRIGVAPDEVHGGKLEMPVALSATRTNFAQFMPVAAARNPTPEGEPPSILVGAEELGVSEDAIIDAIVEARDAVRQPKRLVEAEQALERLRGPEGRASSVEVLEDIERQLALRKRTRRLSLAPSQTKPETTARGTARPRRQISLPAKYSHEFPVGAGHSYLLRAIPDSLWRRSQQRAHGEGRAIRVVLLRCLERYVAGKLDV